MKYFLPRTKRKSFAVMQTTALIKIE